MKVDSGRNETTPNVFIPPQSDPVQRDIADLSRTSVQCSFIDSRPARPKATDTLYIQRFSTRTAQGPEDHTVVGVHVVLEKGHGNKLWEAFHVDRSTRITPGGSRAIGSLKIYCDTLEVHGALSLPEVDVDIFARRLVWADATACIDTSPLPWSLDKASDGIKGIPGQTEDVPAKDGADGRHAGALRVFAHRMDPSENSGPRLIARGGRGQDPGAGECRSLGLCNDYSFDISAYGVRENITFDPPAASYTATADIFGNKNYAGAWGHPYSLLPRFAGKGGNGGRLTTNHRSLAALLSNNGGEPGKEELAFGITGGERPKSCAYYKVTLFSRLNAWTGTYREPVLEVTRTIPVPPPVSPTGDTPEPEVVDNPNAWLHPLGVQAVLDYARDLSLAGARNEVRDLVADYARALAGPRPDNGAWDDASVSEWTAAQTEFATLAHRSDAHLDYFGNPAGYTPLLSLAGSIQLYKGETRLALRMMLLGALLAEARHKAVETTAVLGDTINAVDADTKAAADQVSAGEKKINEVRGLIGIVLHDLEDLSGRLERLREKLLAEAKSNIDRRNAIKFAIKIAGALCQVIPVGQPLLGSAGSLAAVSAGFVGGDLDSAPDTISKIGDVLQKGGAAVEKAQKVSGKSKEAGEKTPTDWSRVGDSLGSACSLVSEGVKALQVPKSEVEAELAKLEAQSPEWKELTRRIREVNDKKAKLFVGLEKAIASVGEGYSRLAANSSTRVRLRKQQDKALREVDTDSFFAVQKMSGQSRRTLQKYLYLLVKSYESTLLEAPSVDWRLADVTDKIKALVTSTQTWDAAALNAAADTLDTLFQQNLSKVRSDLLSRYDFGENTSTLDIVFTENQTSPVIADLNKARSTVIDPLALGLVLPGEHLARLSRVELTDLVFASGEPPLPAGTNVVVKLVPARRGTLRRGAGLYLLTSESPVRWGWTMSSSGTITAHTPSAASQDILDFILGPDGTAIKGKVSLPPLWSDLALSVELSPQSTDVTLPRISEARFRLHIDSSPAPELQRVLTVRPEGAVGDSVIGCTGDNAERGDGYGLMVRIYDQGAAVELVAPPLSGSVGFAGWKTSERGGEKPDPWKTTLDVTLADHLLVVPSWSHDESAARPPADLARLVQEVGEEALVESLVGQDGDLGAEGARRLLREQIEAQQVAPAAAGPEPRVLRAEPDTAGTVLGFVPGQGEADLVERGAGWDRVNYQGLVGWVEST